MDDCEKFLLRQLPWVRAALEGEDSPEILPALARRGGIDRLNKALDEYEELLKLCPKHQREHGERMAESAKQRILAHLPPATRGRRPSREVQESGRKAAKLFKQGYTDGEVARKICERRGEPGHRCDKRCADRIRQRAQPYLSAK
jgi:hypothetical protein